MMGWLMRMGCCSIVLMSCVLVMFGVFKCSLVKIVFLVCMVLIIGLLVVVISVSSVVWLGGVFRYLMILGFMLLLWIMVSVLWDVLYFGL